MGKYPGCFNASQQMDTTCTAITTEDTLEFHGLGTDFNRIVMYEIKYFDALKYLDASYNYIDFDLSFGGLVFKLFLPNTIEYLDLSHGNDAPDIGADIAVPFYLPASLKHFNFSNNHLDIEFYPFPNTLRYLNLSDNSYYSFDLMVLNQGLDTLICSSQSRHDNNQITSLDQLPSLPSSIRYLDCHGNKLFSLPSLPTGLTWLDCRANFYFSSLYFTIVPTLDALPALPATLEWLDCGGNYISTLPALPSSLKYLNCENNKWEYDDGTFQFLFPGISAMPALPDGLIEIRARFNSIPSLPPLPSALAYLNVIENPISCLPFLPASMAGQSAYNSEIFNLLTSFTNINCVPNDVPGIRKEIALPVCDAGNNTNGCAAGPVPVKLLDFTASKENKLVKLNWTTLQEINSKQFIIERSLDGTKWNELSRVAAAGISSVKLNYNETDNSPAKGINYYRLKLVDLNGRFEYSKVRIVYFSSSANILLAPNPAKGKTYIYLPGNASPVSISIFNMNGQLVQSISSKGEAIQLNVTGLASGIYSVRINGKNINDVKKLVVE